ncbi:M15 family metallopeptidase [Algoriphagus sp.]|uniref:M15 family metallopeptidase n=1 Tax=Algoriphagus sp. TaxID=1872435 RepID=UPI00271E22C4|nr:M15 family metallopeptidase [Algoriphagus sp.]MDO8966890.1 M15 family metallopeptidase [Algoriphagus sp.]MDP3199787.1 M15 family metallopeptidase [Algoriphagus sp.]
MNKIAFAIAVLLFLNRGVFGQSSNSYGLEILTSLEEYRQTVALDSNKRFVRIVDYLPNVIMDIKYAGKENVFYTQLYPREIAICRLPVAKALAEVQKELNEQNLGLKIYDGYRPYSITVKMFEILPDTVYMGLPWQGSKHNRGIALDLTLVDLETGQELKMPTPFDALVYASHPEFMKLPEVAIRNRELLKGTMKKHGFTVDPVEWWHYNYIDNRVYELLDISIDELEKSILKN